MNSLGNRSAHRMSGVHPLLVSAVCIAMRCGDIDFNVGVGAVRSVSYQEILVDSGNSRTLKSKHLKQSDGFSHAIDLYPLGYESIDEIPKDIWGQVKNSLDEAAEVVGIELEHGYDWGWDSPHHQIKRIL